MNDLSDDLTAFAREVAGWSDRDNPTLHGWPAAQRLGHIRIALSDLDRELPGWREPEVRLENR